MNLETVTIPSFITWQQFGCKNAAFFDKHIKDKRLPVKFIYGRIYVLLAGGEEFNIHESDLITDKHEHEIQDYPWLKNAPVEVTLTPEEKEIIEEVESKIRVFNESKDMLRVELKDLLKKARFIGYYSDKEVAIFTNRAKFATDEELRAAIKEVRDLVQTNQAA